MKIYVKAISRCDDCPAQYKDIVYRCELNSYDGPDEKGFRCPNSGTPDWCPLEDLKIESEGE